MQNTTGVMLEWLKRHAWKACVRQKRTASSNLAHSAHNLVQDCLLDPQVKEAVFLLMGF